MSEHAAHVVNSISDLQMTEDGLYLLIHGNQPMTAIHRSVLDQLLVALPNAIEHSDRITSGNAQTAFAYQSYGWEIGRLNGTQTAVIRFRLAGNMGISFSLPCEQIAPLIEALNGVAASAGATVAQVTSDTVTLQ
ncbi:hypothetical protein PPMP20_26265 [Paraburkholderia phymatum]|uniref:Uncharacterized protein n=1 Tax=Paraburkholderia phymatum (strain DSM 17167 / CIP 108236 / LMG 21445 / STM815) TaxID=391038 RepID=B2JLJ9_PARP8|nr:hypothetical protein [Paraburkholderia phymatum]ACC72632.1 hypothetical protein Bphy_3483 [Paraburkholderia phymatum STM815]